MNPKHTLKEYADALTRAGLLTASTLTPAAEGTVIDCLSYDTRSLHGTSPVSYTHLRAHETASKRSTSLRQSRRARPPMSPKSPTPWTRRSCL